MIRFEPFVCDHAAFLIGRRPWDVSRDPNLLFEAHARAIQKYQLNICLAGIDIYNAEAEALGCRVEEPEGNESPAIIRPLVADINEIRNRSFDPEKDGRLPMIIETATRLKGEFPDCDVRVPVCGPFSLAGHLLGIENLLLEVTGNTETVKEKLLYLAEILIRYIRAICNRKLGITVFESTASPPLLSPLLFEKLVVPALRRIFKESFSPFFARKPCGLPQGGMASLASQGSAKMPRGLPRGASLVKEKPALIIGGDTLPIVDSISALEPSYIVCPVETNQQGFITKIKNAKGMRVRVAMNSAVFLDNTPERALAEAKRALALARNAANTSVGLLLPFAANPTVVNAVSEFYA